MGERINHIATGRNLSPEEELLPHHHGEEATSMEMDPGALPRPGRVPEQEILVPRSLLIRPKRIYNFCLLHASFGDIAICFYALSYHLQHILD